MSKKKKNRSAIKDHKHINKTLVAPMNTLPVPLNFTSWGEERLCEMLWAALVLVRLSRNEATRAFGAVVSLGEKYRELDKKRLGNKFDLSVTGMSVNSESILEDAVAALRDFSPDNHILRPLLLLDCLPEKARWQAAINETPADSDWQLMGEAIGRCLNHQSQEATDIRFVTVAFETALGLVCLPQNDEARQIADEFAAYPYLPEETLRRVRPTIRSFESAVRTRKYCKTKFTDEYWPEVFKKTHCAMIVGEETATSSSIAPQQFEKLRALVAQHYVDTLVGPAVDPKLDTIFGATLYGIRCLRELCETTSIRYGVAGKALLRALLEIRINLAYLVKSDADDLWVKYRRYGASQAKLALLKLDLVEGSLPTSLSEDTLESIANEDIYQEFIDIPLGSWSGEDLRKLSEKSGTKDDYDKFYGWASTFVHSHWCAMRDSEFTTCMNPLHRLHRVPRAKSRQLEDPLPDSVHLMNEIFKTLESQYPGISPRFSIETQAV